jgi:hypothetical protein
VDALNPDKVVEAIVQCAGVEKGRV